MRLHTTIHAATVGELLRALKAHQDALYQRGLVDLDEMPLTIEPRQPRKTAAS